MTDETNDDEGWNTPTSGFFKPYEEGQTLTGMVVGTEETNFGEAMEVELLNEEEIPVGENETVEMTEGESVLVNYTGVNDFLRKHVGDIVQIEYTGTTTSSSTGQEYKTFEKRWKKSTV